ncbi:hypothetical protein EW145_g2906 [Phellinidium pouzarii]|uniref:Uncharacterized protein n=1 Tax=Phellinidium pouzarii TaxID=167371 RepID=A0A4S4LAL7_9AGAM|nr:hypothetical protein EW145_g2906 [Phellinidium pouzarii]
MREIQAREADAACELGLEGVRIFCGSVCGTLDAARTNVDARRVHSRVFLKIPLALHSAQYSPPYPSLHLFIGTAAANPGAADTFQADRAFRAVRSEGRGHLRYISPLLHSFLRLLTASPRLTSRPTSRSLFPISSWFRLLRFRRFAFQAAAALFYAISITSKAFKDIPVVKQHRLVNEVLKEEIRGIHGLQLKTQADA